MTHFFNAKRDYWPLYADLQRHYPLGLVRDESVHVRDFPGYQALEARIAACVHQESAERARWEALATELAARTGLPVRDTSYGQAPCFSAVLQVGCSASGAWQVAQELFVAVSLVGPYYTVLGHDQLEYPLEVYPEQAPRPVRQTAVLTVSPGGAYAGVFESVCAAIESRYAGHRFVPFHLATVPLLGVYLPGRDGASQPLFYGLFNDQVDVQARTVGDPSHKHEDWLRPAPAGGWGRWNVVPGGPSERQVAPDLSQP
jgi:hypothetical protein